MWQVAALITEHMVTEVEAHQLASDAAAAQVWKGAEDGRLLRILVRLTSILERPESEGDPQWAETGQPAACSHPRDDHHAPRCGNGIAYGPYDSRVLYGNSMLARQMQLVPAVCDRVIPLGAVLRLTEEKLVLQETCIC